MDYLTKRFEMIAERILENERLTGDLDDDAAQVLLDWGLSSAKLIVDSTAGIEDEEEADEAMYTRLRANARLMRTVNKWVPKRQTMDQLASLKEFGKVGKYVATVYAETFVAPPEAEWKAFLSSYQTNNDVEMIVNLRNLFDHSARSLPAEEQKQTGEPVAEETASQQVPSEQPTQTDEPVAEETASQQVPNEQPTPTNQTPSQQVPSEQPTQTDETPSEQVPAEEPAQISSPATDETPSEQLPADEPAPIDETPSQQVPSEQPTQISSPATDETSSPQVPSQEPIQTGSPATDETPSPQAPPREQASSRSPNLQDSKPKSFPKRFWYWATSFFRRT